MAENNNHPILLILLVFSIISISGCNNQEEAKEVSLKDVVPISEISKGGNENESIKIAVAAMISPKETFIYYSKILDYLSEGLDLPVELVQRETYSEVNELVKMKELDGAFVCTGAYIEGHDEFGMELLVAPMAYGEPVYYSYIIVPKESDSDELEDLKGKTFAFTDPLSNTGKLSPTYALAQINETPDTFFESYIFTYSHDKSIEAVANKLVDGAAVDSLVWDYLDATNPAFTSKTKIIRKSEPYGIPPFVVPENLDPELKESMRELLLHMHENEKGREILKSIMIDKFVLVEDSDYDSVRDMSAWVEANEANK